MSSQSVQPYQVISWNIGRDSDYLGLNVRNKDVQWKNMRELGDLRNQLFTSTFKNLKETIQPDIFCLQEVTRSGDVKKWLGDSYDLHATSRDCVIAWDNSKYELVEGSPTREKTEGRYLILLLREKSTQKTIQVASAHLWGFKLTGPNETERDSDEPVTLKGDRELNELAEQMDDSAFLSIIGMDANSTPHIHPERLSILESRGYTRDASSDNIPTAYNSSLESQSAHLDYLFVKASKKFQITVQPTHFQSLPIESPAVNPSDHSPILLSLFVTKKEKESGFLKKLFTSFSSDRK